MVIGDIIIFSGKSLISRAIQKFTKSKWNHVGIVYDTNEKYVVLAEAIYNGFKLKKYSKKNIEKMLKKEKIKIKKSKKTLNFIRTFILKYLGIRYSWFGIVKIALKILFKKLDLKGDNEKTLICSETVSRILYDCSEGYVDLEREFNKTHDFITPADINKSEFLYDILNV